MASAHKIDVAGLLAGNRQRLVVDDRVPLDSFEGIEFPEPAAVHLELQASGELLEIEGAVEAKLRAQCVRCLADIEREMSVQVGEQVEARPELQNGPFEENNVLSAGRLDVADLTSQVVCSAIPIGLLCKEDCRGICPRCGENRNIRTCECNGET